MKIGLVWAVVVGTGATAGDLLLGLCKMDEADNEPLFQPGRNDWFPRDRKRIMFYSKRRQPQARSWKQEMPDAEDGKEVGADQTTTCRNLGVLG